MRLDRAVRLKKIEALKAELERCRLQASSLDNNAHRQEKIAENASTIQLMLELLEKEDSEH